MEDGVETTYVFLEHSVITASDADKTSISLMADFQYDGKVPVKPKHISIAFFNVTPKCTMPLYPEITFLFNGALLRIPPSFKGWRDRKPDEEGVPFAFGEMKCHEWTVYFTEELLAIGGLS